MSELKRSLLERLPRYYHIICDQLEREGGDTISSAQIADLMGVDDTQVRKDLAAIGVRGYPRIGYKALDACDHIRDILGFDKKKKGVIIGAGRLGGALAAYPGFGGYGLDIVAIFDNDSSKAGSKVGGHEIFPLDDLETVIKSERVGLAVLAVPANVASGLAERVIEAGVRAIWNFAPTRFAVPEGVRVRHEQISVGLAELSYHLK